MPIVEKTGRRNSIPILYTRGTHYEVGFDVGRTFSGLIHSFLADYKYLNEVLIPLYETDAGKKVYQETLNAVRKNFPQYVREMEGTADGAKVPFHKEIVYNTDNVTFITHLIFFKNMSIGCSSICINQTGEEILGHTEDTLPEFLNHIYFVSAHIISDTPQGRWKVTEEHFTSLCYAGWKTPRHFLTRALLAAENFAQAQQILRDVGCGAADAFSIT
ncbi:hypothetical protein L9F63_020288 [Diploptera punctata]|uniref:Uncharacterized protein n=1 Tax=Diploptera punctata TaxID=6984 RepID=A0AAD8EDK7_DIPPU|nr:hypothetical protein L9F63_020288 [Diploptera punctata]